MMFMKKFKKILKIILIIVLALMLIPILINLYVILSVSSNIKELDDLRETYDYALVLGCGLKNGKPSLMLQDRLDMAIKLYENSKVAKIIVSGTHLSNYSEVNAMEKYLKENNIPSTVIIRDDYGNSTNESITNYHENYQDQKVIIVTQRYHMYRSLYIAKYYQIKAIGVSAKKERYVGQSVRDIREILARVKDFIFFTF